MSINEKNMSTIFSSFFASLLIDLFPHLNDYQHFQGNITNHIFHNRLFNSSIDDKSLSKFITLYLDPHNTHHILQKLDPSKKDNVNENSENKIIKEIVYLDVVFVVSLHNRICEKVILRIYGLPLTLCPFHILLLPTHVLIVIHQTQHHLDPIFSCFGYCEIQALFISNPRKQQS